SEVDVVEDVHDLHPELEVRRAAGAEALEERGVHVPEAGPGEGVALHVAEGPLGRTAERATRGADGGRVVPLVLRLRPGRVADEVGTARTGVPVVAGARVAHVEGQAALDVDVRVDLP